MEYYVVKYTGAFGFIKPWTAVRDELTFSQQFLTPSILEGMRQKLEVESIERHRLRYLSIDKQQEQTRPQIIKKPGHNFSIIERGVMLKPELYLAFSSEKEATLAYSQHLCLCRNEDVVLPDQSYGIQEMNEKQFDEIEGFELRESNQDDGFMVGYNRFANFQPMYGELQITGDPLKG
jgi:hypothetical protein